MLSIQIRQQSLLARILILAALLAGFAISAAAKSPSASIRFPEKSFDFGTLKDRTTPVSHEFEFTNEGEANLVILKAKAECGCTKPTFPQAPIPPGKKGRIKVTFNPTGFQGAFNKSITVTTNGSPKKVRISIKGYIKPNN